MPDVANALTALLMPPETPRRRLHIRDDAADAPGLTHYAGLTRKRPDHLNNQWGGLSSCRFCLRLPI